MIIELTFGNKGETVDRIKYAHLTEKKYTHMKTKRYIYYSEVK